MSDAEEQASTVLDRLQELNDWALDDKAALGIITAALQARERVGKQMGINETWNKAAKKANNIALQADGDIEGCSGDEWVRLQTIESEFTRFRNYCYQHAQEVDP